MTSNRIIRNLLALVAMVFLPAAAAEDIDLFVGLPPTTTDKPNVVILLDNTANWNTAFTNEIAALAATVSGLPVDKFRLGLAMFTETGSGNSGEDGAYVRAAVRDLNADYKTKFQALVNSLNVTSDKSNGGKLGKSMADLHRYFAGQAPYTGNNKNKTDYTGNTYGTAASQAIYALSGNALTAKAGTQYLSPIVADSCAKNYIIYISNGAAQDNASDTTAATTQLSSAGGSTTAIPISPSGSQDNVGDEWARFLKKSDMNIVTYTVDVDKVTTGQGPGWTALLMSMASVSSGKYFDVGSGSGGAAISDALKKIFSEILSVNSVFASVSLPVSVNTQGTYLNQVFVGVFRPDPDAMPRWAGNLKQYKLGLVNNELKLLDAADSSAINAQTGFVTECARSYWTPTSVDTYWSFRPQGECLAVTNSDASNYPDGNIVEKGAQAYKLRGSTSRTLYTCATTYSSCTTLVNFSSTYATQTLLGAASTTERDALINWEKGLDVDNEDNDATTTGEMRPSAHGDVVHSRPVAINFGTDASPQVVVFYGGNDGILRAVNGNRSASIGSVAAGSELWAFIPPEFIPKIKRLRDNNTQINYFGNPTTSPTPLPKPYGMDGSVAAYVVRDTADEDGDGNTTEIKDAWVYATMRRGGRVLYAFDVGTPGSPSLLWKKGCPSNFPSSGTVDDTSCDNDGDGDFRGIGQTWSAPKTFKAAGYESGEKPLLILGGGYDTCEDYDALTAGGANHQCTSSSKGKTIYVLDAEEGNIVKSFSTERGVVGDIFVVPDSNGLGIYAYAADLGGNVYRITMGAAAPSSWTLTKIASVGCATTASCTANRKFMFSPDVLQVGSTYYVLLGSGDREKPLSGYAASASVSNYFFMIKDEPTNASWLSAESGNCGGNNVICLNSLLGITTTATPTDAELAAKKGWYLGLGTSEQVVTSAITVYGVVTFSTHTPAVATPGACTSNLGVAKVYNIAYANASSANGTSSRSEVIAGGGLPPSPVAGMVTLDNGQTVPFIIGANPDSPIEGGGPTAAGGWSQPKGKVYWYIQQ